jgi:hypothetical protein
MKSICHKLTNLGVKDLLQVGVVVNTVDVEVYVGVVVVTEGTFDYQYHCGVELACSFVLQAR